MLRSWFLFWRITRLLAAGGKMGTGNSLQWGLGQLAVAQLAMADWPQPNWLQGTTGRSRLATTVREREREFFFLIIF